jgi:DNA adenine methylase
MGVSHGVESFEGSEPVVEARVNNERAMKPRLSGLAPWHGAKRSVALRMPIMRALGLPEVYFEPFCGSCAVALALCSGHKPNSVIINDLNDDLVNLAVCVQDEEACAGLYEWSAKALFSDALMDLARKDLDEPFAFDGKPNLRRAAAYLYVVWTGMNGYAGSTSAPRFNVRFTKGGGDPAVRWANTSISMPVWHQIMKGWSILHRDAFKVIESIPDEYYAAAYIDSPYHPSVRSSREYVHEFTEDQHVQLRDALLRFSLARIVVSHYDCPAIRELYADDRVWHIINNETRKGSANATKRGDSEESKAREIVIVKRQG